jgi:hypothetical protein
LLVLVALVSAGALVAYAMSPTPRHVGLPAKPPDDDLEMLAGLLEASTPREPARDLLAVGPAELYLARASDDRVVALPKDGGAARTLARLEAPAQGMALAGGSLWLTTSRNAGAQPRGAVFRVPLSGGPPSVVAEGLAQPRAIGSDGRWLFVVDVDASGEGLLHTSTIERLPARANGGIEAIVLGRCEGEVTEIALDDANVYWTDRLDGTIVVAPKAGGEPRTLARERGLPEQLAIDDVSLYWVEKRSESLWTMPKAGGEPRRIAQDFAGFSDVVVDARRVWWKSEAAIAGAFRVLTVPKTGGEPAPASEGVDTIDALASDGARLYWARGGEAEPVRGP